MNKLANMICCNYRTNIETKEAIKNNEVHCYSCYSEDTSNGGMFDRPSYVSFGIYKGKALDVIEFLTDKFMASHGGWRNGGSMEIYHSPKIIQV